MNKHKMRLAAAAIFALPYVPATVLVLEPVPAAAERLNKAECKAACDANATDRLGCYARYRCDEQAPGPIDHNKVNAEIQRYNSRRAQQPPINFGGRN